MYCCSCAAQTSEESHICHKCGTPVPHTPFNNASTQRPFGSETEQEQRRVEQRLLSKDRKPHQWHQCEGRGKLHGWDFGLGKIIAEKRVWGATAVSVAVSAITVPILGVGMLERPGKETSLTVLRLRLMLSESGSQRGGVSYSVHPCWDGAMSLGYTEFLSADDLKRLRSI